MKAPPGLPSRQRRLLEGLALLFLMACAILFQRSATASWIKSSGADGALYLVSPIGLAEFRDGSRVSECRWWPRLGNEQLCAVNDTGGASQMTWIGRAYPLTVAAMWGSVLALFLNALRIPRQAPLVSAAAALAPSILGAIALWAMWSGANRALAVLEGLAPHPAMSGFVPMVIATVLSTLAGLLLVFAKR